jgi:fibronectin type 3 domain-containing protein
VRQTVPTLPSNLTATALSATSIQLNWKDNSTNENRMIVERSIGFSNAFVAIATLPANSTSFLNTSLTPGTKYFYQIRAANDAGASQPSNTASATTPSIPTAAPAAPTNLTVNNASNSLATLTWTDNSNNEESFVIQKIGYSGTFENFKTVPAGSTWAQVSLNSASTNSFRVVARNSAGNSDPSNVVEIVTRPEAPVYFNAQAISTTAISLNWDSLDSCTFHVEKLVDGVWVRIASDLASLSYTDSGLAPGSTHSYRVIAAAVNSAGESDPSDIVTAKTAPVAVSGLQVTARTTSSITLAWNDLASEDYYLIERSTDGINWTGVLLYADTSSYTFSGLASGQTYLFRIKGLVYGGANGDPGETVSGRTL